MKTNLFTGHHDLVTPDGLIISLSEEKEGKRIAEVVIQEISSHFVGFGLEKSLIFFNLKSTLAQLGLHSRVIDIEINPIHNTACVHLELIPIGTLASKLLQKLEPGCYIGKLFAADPSRRVRDPHYLSRMFGRSDRNGRPLLSLGGLQDSGELILQKIEGRTVAFISLQNGILDYEIDAETLLPTLIKALKNPQLALRSFVHLNQVWKPEASRQIQPGKILLVRTAPLYIRTVFAKVVQELLPAGMQHTSADILEPDTKASGDIYELFGGSEKQINDIPLEFYSLQPEREYVFFSDRDQLQTALDNPKVIFKAFETAPKPEHLRAATFIVKGEKLEQLKTADWIAEEPRFNEFPGLIHPARQALMVEKYIEQQPSYPILKAIENGYITSQGVLFSRHFPTPLLKKVLLGDLVQKNLKAIYFLTPSLTFGDFFSHEDRSMLLDLAKFAISVFWADRTSGNLLQYISRPDKDSGMFVPLKQADTFLNATLFGIYGSNLIAGDFEEQLKLLFQGLLQLKETTDHPLLHKKTNLAFITGGGPGVMAVGNKVAQSLGILSCANIVDFKSKADSVVNEQLQNPYVEAKMTFRLDRLVERQAEFHLDFPIFLKGGIGTDFEFCLEEVRRKVGSITLTPIILLGEASYWEQKITSRYQANLNAGTIVGSEWISNCLYCVQTAQQALEVYKRYFSGTLALGPRAPSYEKGFIQIT